ncbi:U-box domain-containing protein 45-like [Primulina huaijiensis]|uniref:U-box domain-containing protein 45-like n=1 Tax=Primulina huaijiensis TaxID=1492673 RepID=UPI003CC70E17
MSVPQAPKWPNSSSKWAFTSTNRRFFTRMPRFLRLNLAKARHKLPKKPMETFMNTYSEAKIIEEDMARKLEGRDYCEPWLATLQKSVKSLHFGSWEEKEAAAEEIRKLAEKGLKRRKIMVGLGVIPPLVAMVGSGVVARQSLAVRALTELANGSFTNKALIVEAGLFSKLPENIGFLEEAQKQEFAQLLLPISTLTISQISLTSTRIIAIVVSILDSDSSNLRTKESCLSTLYNLSSVLDNAAAFISSGAVEILVRLSLVKYSSEKALAILGNLAVTLAGRKELEHNPMVPEGLIEIMTWEEKPECQELSAHILMILAHSSSSQRQKMARCGIVQVLLEVALLGSPIAQKRALKILQWFKNERQMRMGPHSGPQVGTVMIGSPPVNRRGEDEGKRTMKKIVRQSLHKNMEVIIGRANGDEVSSKFKALVISSSSKSLPC